MCGSTAASMASRWRRLHGEGYLGNVGRLGAVKDTCGLMVVQCRAQGCDGVVVQAHELGGALLWWRWQCGRLTGELEKEGDGMEGERGWSGLHSERARDVELLGQACTPRGGHKAHGRCLNLTPDSVISRLTTRFQRLITRNPARVSIRCQQQNCRAMGGQQH
jgi:hypothetical protein